MIKGLRFLLMRKIVTLSTFFAVISLVSVSETAQSQVFRTLSSNVTNSSTIIRVYEYNAVDQQPTFPGGNYALMHFINEERQYPTDAYEKGIQGRVTCGFVVNVDGSISDISVMKSVEETLDKEAMRVISSMPPWLAGTIDDIPVPVYCILTIPFRR